MCTLRNTGEQAPNRLKDYFKKTLGKKRPKIIAVKKQGKEWTAIKRLR